MTKRTIGLIAWWLGAISIIALPILACFGAPPRIEVAVAEAVVHVAQKSRPELPDDFAASPTGSAVSAKYAVTVYTAAWCGPCHSMKNQVGDGNDRIALAWIEQKPPAGIPEVYPTLAWADATGTLRYVQGVTSLDRLLVVIERNNPPHEAKSGRGSATPGAETADSRATDGDRVAGVFHWREAIRSALARWRDVVGDGTASLTWTRNGSQTLPLLRLTDWTPRAIYGSSGAVQFIVTGAPHSLPVTDALIDYRLVGDKLRLRGETSVDAGLFGINTSGTQAVGSSGQVAGFIDPISLLSIASLVWQVLHPVADLTLPGQVSASATMSGDTLLVTFTDAPSARLAVLFTLNLRVESVSISETKVVLHFSGSRWVTQKTFEVQ